MLCEQKNGSVWFCLKNERRRHHRDSEPLRSTYNQAVLLGYSPGHMWGKYWKIMLEHAGETTGSSQLSQVYLVVSGKELRGFGEMSNTDRVVFHEECLSSIWWENHADRTWKYRDQFYYSHRSMEERQWETEPREWQEGWKAGNKVFISVR